MGASKNTRREKKRVLEKGLGLLLSYPQCLVMCARPSVLKPSQLVRESTRKLEEKEWAMSSRLSSLTVMRFKRSSSSAG
jgi:hypothetical protein